MHRCFTTHIHTAQSQYFTSCLGAIISGDKYAPAGERQIRDAVSCALDRDNDLKALREQWLLYIDASQYYRMALQLVADRK